MSAHLERAQLLLAQSRPADAEREAMLAVSAQPENARALALLAISRVEQDKHEAALAAASDAVGLAPDDPYLHYVHALVHHRMEHAEESFRAVQEALRLDPADADAFTLLASIELARRKWPAALAAAEQALALNPEHVGAANLRSIALIQLGRKAEAMQSVDYALHRAPDDPFSHSNQGWNCLHQNDPRRAQEHFREALRLDPNLDHAREGMLEALKARNPIYRAMLAYFLWLGRKSAQFQWAFIIGIFFGSSLARTASNAYPQLNFVWWPLLGLFYAFVYLSWTAQPMFNLLLRFDRFGRHVLTDDQRMAANWFGAALFAALGMLVWWLATKEDIALIIGLFLAALSICIAATFNRVGRPRKILGACTAGLGAIAVVAVMQLLKADPAAMNTVRTFTFGFIGFQVLANVLASR